MAPSPAMRNKTSESNFVAREIYPSVYFDILGRPPNESNTPFERAELELLMALDALSGIQDSDDDFAQNGGENNVQYLSRSVLSQDLRLRYQLARATYKTELWNRDFEPVLQRILTATATATINADWEGDAQIEAVRRLVACDSVARQEKDVLDGLLGNFVQMGDIMEELKLLLGASDGTCGSPSDILYEIREKGDTQGTPQNHRPVHGDQKPVALAQTKLPEAMPKLDSQNEHGITFVPTRLEQSHGDNHTTHQGDDNFTVSTISTPLMVTELCDTTKQIAIAQLWDENAALRAAMDRETEQLNAMFAEVQFRNEEDLSLAATLLMEAAEVRAQAERIRAATKADLDANISLREEVERRNGVT